MEYDLCIRTEHTIDEKGETFSRDLVIGKVIINDSPVNLALAWGYSCVLKAKEANHPYTGMKLMVEDLPVGLGVKQARYNQVTNDLEKGIISIYQAAQKYEELNKEYANENQGNQGN